MRPDVQAFFDPATFTASYLVSDPATGVAAIIDPVLDFEPKAGKLSTTSADALVDAIKARGLTLAYVLETHAHADHLSAADYIRGETGAKIVIGARIVEVQKTFIPVFEADADANGAAFDVLMNEGDTLPLGELSIGALHTPGHTPACLTYLIGDAAFVGDTLFMPDYGTARADFPGGDPATLYRSIRKVLDLPPETRIFVGHDYLPEGRSDYRWETTVAEERARNIHVHDGVEEADFVALRQARDATLAAPTLILPSLQVNIRAGALPDPTPAGNVFLRIPVTRAA
ncbi:MBL fold metallo-hydrolase [Caulobacter segnis]|uniref:Zn-dependent hydrolase, glyoxalase II family n=2 Tax=Caulobacter segnis TaxID=88688 RepID=D5VF11_CAUST|nr:MBL fold metallo-hydrolase [Caulobacter segnis]ADG09429.1 Zn-dependent hydrolase, glyoxalase II family [Caulobacter segnis ATCC 21756]AVQ01227.1 MBL fold metallo-hydrolase [Caulobacter segnis]